MHRNLLETEGVCTRDQSNMCVTCWSSDWNDTYFFTTHLLLYQNSMFKIVAMNALEQNISFFRIPSDILCIESDHTAKVVKIMWFYCILLPRSISVIWGKCNACAAPAPYATYESNREPVCGVACGCSQRGMPISLSVFIKEVSVTADN